MTSIPLEELWDDRGNLHARRGHRLDRASLGQLLRRGPVRLAVANIGHPLRWIAPIAQFEFWKQEVSSHLAEGNELRLDMFPDGLAFIASEWHLSGELPIILLEAHH